MLRARGIRTRPELPRGPEPWPGQLFNVRAGEKARCPLRNNTECCSLCVHSSACNGSKQKYTPARSNKAVRPAALINSGVLVTEQPALVRFVVFANFSSINTPTTADFKLPV